MRGARLYLLLDPRWDGAAGPADAVVDGALRGGVRLVQVRMKGATTREIATHAQRLAPRVRAAGAALIVNDDVDAALAAGADGVHLGQDDLPLAEARRRCGDALILGVSTHGLDQALAAAREGADYIGLGAMFPTATKERPQLLGPDALPDVLRAVSIPVFPIGGIDQGNVARIVERGCGRAAVSSAITGAADPERAARELIAVLDRVAIP